MSRPALEIVKDYVGKAWSEGKAHLVRELCADPIIRHDPNSRVALSHDEQEARIRHSYDDLETRFDNVVLHGGDEYVTLVWDVIGRDPQWKLCGIEVFRVVDGRIAEVWNLPYANGHWSMSKSLAGRIGDGPVMTFPILDVEASEDVARITAPVDARNLGRWLRVAIGEPESSREGDGLWRHRFANGAKPPFGICVGDAKSPGQHIENARVNRLSMELVPAAVINAALEISGTKAAEPFGMAEPVAALEVVRLAETFGYFTTPGQPTCRVIDARIVFTADGTGASGLVTLRLQHGMNAEQRFEPGHLSFGWRQNAFSLSFEAQVQLDASVKTRNADGQIDVTFPWTAENLVAVLINDVP